MMILQAYIFTLFLFSIAPSYYPVDARRQIRDSSESGCGRNEVFTSCGTSCPQTCDHASKPCILICVRGCFCKKGFIRLSEFGPCVPPSKCPRRPGGCDINEVFNSCGTLCPPTCAQRMRPCPLVCERGCFCKEGFIRLNKDGPCVPLAKCPRRSRSSEETQKGLSKRSSHASHPRPYAPHRRQPAPRPRPHAPHPRPHAPHPRPHAPYPMPAAPYPKPRAPYTQYMSQRPETCNSGQEWCECIPYCTRRCSFINQKGIYNGYGCPDCVSGCFCSFGMFETSTGDCMSYCPGIQGVPVIQPPAKCKMNEDWYECRPFCKNRCSYIRIYGIYMGKGCPTCSPGCFCSEGMFETIDDTCVAQCPEAPKPLPITRCPDNQKYYYCMPYCTHSCNFLRNNKRSPGQSCPCLSGCFCYERMFKEDDESCLNRCRDIPPPPPPVEKIQCPINMKFYRCLPFCHRGCEYMRYNPKKPSEEECHDNYRKCSVSGCYCDENLVLTASGGCVEKCPKEKSVECPSGYQCGLL